MKEMTPDKLAEEYRRLMCLDEPDEYVFSKMHDLVLDAASAWEAEVDAWKDAYAERDRAYNIQAKRIEELERENLGLLDTAVKSAERLGVLETFLAAYLELQKDLFDPFGRRKERLDAALQEVLRDV